MLTRTEPFRELRWLAQHLTGFCAESRCLLPAPGMADFPCVAMVISCHQGMPNASSGSVAQVWERREGGIRSRTAKRHNRNR